MDRLEIVVYGTPRAAGSKRFVGKKGGKGIIIDASKKSKPWKKEVAQVAGEARADMALMEGPLRATFTFYQARPKGHYGTGRNAGVLKDSAPLFPIVKPDALKLARGVEDALSKVVYRDDSQIVVEHLYKRYGTPERVEILVEAIEP